MPGTIVLPRKQNPMLKMMPYLMQMNQQKQAQARQQKIDDFKPDTTDLPARFKAVKTSSSGQWRIIDTEKKSGVVSPTQKRMLAKDIAKAEEKILANPDNAALEPTVTLFNELSEKPYMYIWKDVGGFLGSSKKAEKVSLPTVRGKQVVARDVLQTAKESFNNDIEKTLQWIFSQAQGLTERSPQGPSFRGQVPSR